MLQLLSLWYEHEKKILIDESNSYIGLWDMYNLLSRLWIALSNIKIIVDIVTLKIFNFQCWMYSNIV